MLAMCSLLLASAFSIGFRYNVLFFIYSFNGIFAGISSIFFMLPLENIEKCNKFIQP